MFLPFFLNYTNVAAGGIGLVRTPDELGHWAQIWGFFAFVLFSWLLVGRSDMAQGPLPQSLHRLLVQQVYACLLHWNGAQPYPFPYISPATRIQ